MNGLGFHLNENDPEEKEEIIERADSKQECNKAAMMHKNRITRLNLRIWIGQDGQGEREG
jgi:hypothetical protein